MGKKVQTAAQGVKVEVASSTTPTVSRPYLQNTNASYLRKSIASILGRAPSCYPPPLSPVLLKVCFPVIISFFQKKKRRKKKICCSLLERAHLLDFGVRGSSKIHEHGFPRAALRSSRTRSKNGRTEEKEDVGGIKSNCACRLSYQSN